MVLIYNTVREAYERNHEKTQETRANTGSTEGVEIDFFRLKKLLIFP